MNQKISFFFSKSFLAKVSQTETTSTPYFTNILEKRNNFSAFINNRKFQSSTFFLKDKQTIQGNMGHTSTTPVKSAAEGDAEIKQKPWSRRMASAAVLAGQIPTDAGAPAKPIAGGPPASNTATTRGSTQNRRSIGNWQGKEEEKAREKRKSNAKSQIRIRGAARRRRTGGWSPAACQQRRAASAIVTAAAGGDWEEGGDGLVGKVGEDGRG